MPETCKPTKLVLFFTRTVSQGLVAVATYFITIIMWLQCSLVGSETQSLPFKEQRKKSRKCVFFDCHVALYMYPNEHANSLGKIRIYCIPTLPTLAWWLRNGETLSCELGNFIFFKLYSCVCVCVCVCAGARAHVRAWCSLFLKKVSLKTCPTTFTKLDLPYIQQQCYQNPHQSQIEAQSISNNCRKHTVWHKIPPPKEKRWQILQAITVKVKILQ